MQNGFKLRSSTRPDILVQTPLEYDNVKQVLLTLYVQVSAARYWFLFFQLNKIK